MPDDKTNPESPADDVEVPVRFGLGEVSLPFRDFRSIQPGFVLPLHQSATHPVMIEVNGTLIGRGDLVLVGGNLGVHFTEAVPHGNQPA